MIQLLAVQAKHIQYVSGVRTSTYWLSTFAWDLLNTLGPILASIIIFAAFQIDAYSTVDALGAIFLLLVSEWLYTTLCVCVCHYLMSPSPFIASHLLGQHTHHILIFFLVLELTDGLCSAHDNFLLLLNGKCKPPPIIPLTPHSTEL